MICISPAPDMTDSIKKLWKEAFGDTDEFIDSYMTSAFSPASCRCAVDGGEVVSVMHLMDCEVNGQKFAYVYAAATKESYRGRGIFRCLMEDTAEYLKERSYDGMILVPGDTALGEMYEKLGFSYFEGLTARTVIRKCESELKLYRISAKEYVSERQRYLPSGGVSMGEAMTRFLDRYAELYSGDSFVFARAGNKIGFTAAEFLGDKTKMPSVLYSLGYSTGQFYTANGERRAMYRRFRDGKAPSLLGICFDV